MNKSTHCCRCDKKLEKSDDPIELQIVPTLTISSRHGDQPTGAHLETQPGVSTTDAVDQLNR